MTTLNPKQLQAVNSNAKTICCIAGPGSGKTRVLTERIKRLIADGVEPSKICAISYTVAASEEIQRRVGVNLGYCGTLHGLCLRMIRKNAAEIGYLPNVSIIGEKAEKEIFDECKARQKYMGSDEALKNAINNGPFLRIGLAIEHLVARDYWQTLRRNNLMTCDALLDYGAMVCDKPYGLTHLFVDELQDASEADVRIYSRMAVWSRFFVGDPDQSIFGFRGGSPKYITHMAQCGEAETILLETNYRAGSKICELATNLIRHNVERVDKAVVPFDTERKGTVGVTAHKTPAAEMAWLCDCINLQATDSIAVLTRNNAEAKSISDYLTGLGVPVASRQASRLPADYEDGLTFLAFLGDPENDMLAYWSSRHDLGKDRADRVKLSAMAEGVSINQKHLGNAPAKVSDVLYALGQRFSADFINLVKTTLDKTPCETIGDLILALRSTSRGAESEGIHIGTIHSAKGREWDVVFLPSFEQEIIPGVSKNVDVAEERRLAFVALTRARRSVYVSWCETRVPEFGRKTAQPRHASQFIEEMKG